MAAWRIFWNLETLLHRALISFSYIVEGAIRYLNLCLGPGCITAYKPIEVVQNSFRSPICSASGLIASIIMFLSTLFAPLDVRAQSRMFFKTAGYKSTLHRMRWDRHILLAMPVPSPSDYFPFDAEAPSVFARTDVANYIRRECTFLLRVGIPWLYMRSCIHGKSFPVLSVFRWMTDLLRVYSSLYSTIMLSRWTSR